MSENPIGKRLGDLRESAGLSQVQLAEALGTSQQNISYYENGRHTPSIQRLMQIAEILGVSIADIISPEKAT